MHERSEGKLIQARRQMAISKFEKDPADKIVTKIMQNIPRFLRKYEKLMEIDEIKRRFSVLKRPLIARYVDRSYKLYRGLGFSISHGRVVEEAIYELTKRVPIIPDFCEIVEDKSMQKQIADSIAHKITQIKKERYGCYEAEFVHKINEKRRKRGSSHEGKVHFDTDDNDTQSDTSDKSNEETVVQVPVSVKKPQDKIVTEFIKRLPFK